MNFVLSLIRPLIIVALAISLLYVKGRYGCMTVPEHMNVMSPALKENRSKMYEKRLDLRHADIVFFETALGPEEVLYSRVIALPGERVSVRKGQVYRDGGQIIEPYASSIDSSENLEEIVVPADCLFVLNDVRGSPGSAERDSRCLGPISRYTVLGMIRE